MSLDRDNLFNIINQLEYPEIRKLCLADRNYNHICQNTEQIKNIIERKLQQYIDKVLNNMQQIEGLVDWSKPLVKHSTKLYPSGFDLIEYPFNYKYIRLNSLIPNHIFDLYDDYDPAWEHYDYGLLNRNYDRRFKLTETIFLPTSDIEFALSPFTSYNKPIPTKIDDTISVNVIKIRNVLATLLSNGYIG